MKLTGYWSLFAVLLCVLVIQRKVKAVSGTQCPYPEQQIFNGTTCISLIGGPCEVDSSSKVNFHCVPFASCELNGEDDKPNFRCVCQDGMIENSQGQCDFGFGQVCENGTRPSCNSGAMLQCIGGTCQCPEHYNYDGETRMCTEIPHSVCQHGENSSHSFWIEGLQILLLFVITGLLSFMLYNIIKRDRSGIRTFPRGDSHYNNYNYNFIYNETDGRVEGFAQWLGHRLEAERQAASAHNADVDDDYDTNSSFD